MGRCRIGWLVTLVAMVSLSGCVLAPSSDQQPEPSGAPATKADDSESAGRLLDRAIRELVRRDEGSVSSNLVFGDWLVDAMSNFKIRASLATVHYEVTRRHRDAMHSLPVGIDAYVAGDKVYVRRAAHTCSYTDVVRSRAGCSRDRRGTVSVPPGRWLQTSKRRVFGDLGCWPPNQRRLPDRLLVLLFNAKAVGFDPERRSLIVATVPAGLAAGVFPDAALTDILAQAGSTPVTVRISQAGGRLTTFELRGTDVSTALRRADDKLDRRLARDLEQANYFASFANTSTVSPLFRLGSQAVTAPGRNLGLPQSSQACATSSA